MGTHRKEKSNIKLPNTDDYKGKGCRRYISNFQRMEESIGERNEGREGRRIRKVRSKRRKMKIGTKRIKGLTPKHLPRLSLMKTYKQSLFASFLMSNIS